MNGRAVNETRTAQVMAACLIAALFTLAPFQARAQAAGTDPFLVCPDADGGEGDDCLAPLPVWYAWVPNKAECRQVGARVDAIIQTGGQAKWTDLFRNERCARLGLPHGPVAAAAGNKVVLASPDPPDNPYALCHYYFGSECDEKLGRHSYYTSGEGLCENRLEYLSKEWSGDGSLSIEYPFQNERCARLGLPHFEPE
jgi:hypothetical protein